MQQNCIDGPGFCSMPGRTVNNTRCMLGSVDALHTRQYTTDATYQPMDCTLLSLLLILLCFELFTKNSLSLSLSDTQHKS